VVALLSSKVDLQQPAESEEVPEDDPNFDPEQAAVLEEEMENAMMLNMQLKQMLLQAEEDERKRSEMRRQGVGASAAGSSRSRAALPPSQGPRVLGHAKNGGWGGMTHSAGRSHEIDRDNQILVQKLTAVAVKPTLNTQERPFRVNPAKSSVSINRRRKDDQIARENAALAKRLNSVKPTGNLSTKMAQQHAKKHSEHLRVLQPGRPGPGTMMMMQPRRPGTGQSGGLPALSGPPRRPFE